MCATARTGGVASPSVGRAQSMSLEQKRQLLIQKLKGTEYEHIVPAEGASEEQLISTFNWLSKQVGGKLNLA